MGKTYRQITYKLRVSRGLGKPDLVSARPSKKDKQGNRIFTDSDENPTLVTFDEDCILTDLPFWLQVGHLQEYNPPKPKGRPKKETASDLADPGEEVPSGKATSKPIPDIP